MRWMSQLISNLLSSAYCKNDDLPIEVDAMMVYAWLPVLSVTEARSQRTETRVSFRLWCYNSESTSWASVLSFCCVQPLDMDVYLKIPPD